MAAPWTVADFKQEIVSAGLLLQARPHLSDLKEHIKSQVKHKLVNLGHVDANSLIDLCDVLKGCNLPQDVKDDLTATVDQLALGCQDETNTKQSAYSASPM